MCRVALPSPLQTSFSQCVVFVEGSREVEEGNRRAETNSRPCEILRTLSRHFFTWSSRWMTSERFTPFPLDMFLRNKLISPSFVLEHLLPKVFQPEMGNQSDHPKVLEMLCKRAVVYGSGSGFPMFVNLLKQLSERKEHPLSEVWPYIIKKMTEFIEEDIIEHGREGLIQNFCNCHLQLHVNRYMWQRWLLFSYDEAIRTLTRVDWCDDERSYERSFGSNIFEVKFMILLK